ncbi:MAG: NAD(+) diphosphatase [Clostridia bacterium]|nr:NAD(+) diphosphatase [Clostridia bacterium]
MFQNIAPHIYKNEYKPRPAKSDDYVVFCQAKAVCLREENGEATFPTVGEMPQGDLQYLFAIDDRAFYLWQGPLPPLESWDFLPVQRFRSLTPAWAGFAAITAHRLWLWYGQNRFCGRCGQPMHHSETERAMQCSCGHIVYPTISPSVIVGVTHGDKLLLTRYANSHSTYRHYALVAGYTEIGETLEETVRREVMEETGLQVTDIRYYKSQPWPFSGALLAGFYCTLQGSDAVRIDKNELSDAVWLHRSEIEPREDTASLTSEMIEQFRLGNQ